MYCNLVICVSAVPLPGDVSGVLTDFSFTLLHLLLNIGWNILRWLLNAFLEETCSKFNFFCCLISNSFLTQKFLPSISPSLPSSTGRAWTNRSPSLALAATEVTSPLDSEQHNFSHTDPFPMTQKGVREQTTDFCKHFPLPPCFYTGKETRAATEVG